MDDVTVPVTVTAAVYSTEAEDRSPPISTVRDQGSSRDLSIEASFNALKDNFQVEKWGYGSALGSSCTFVCFLRPDVGGEEK